MFNFFFLFLLIEQLLLKLWCMVMKHFASLWCSLQLIQRKVWKRNITIINITYSYFLPKNSFAWWYVSSGCQQYWLVWRGGGLTAFQTYRLPLLKANKDNTNLQLFLSLSSINTATFSTTINITITAAMIIVVTITIIIIFIVSIILITKIIIVTNVKYYNQWAADFTARLLALIRYNIFILNNIDLMVLRQSIT